MAGFLKALFQGSSEKKPASSPPPQDLSMAYEQIEGKPFEEVLALVQSMSKTTQARSGSITVLIRRFYRIALYDNHVPQEHRAAALKLAEALTADLEKAHSDNPDAVAQLKAAISQMVEEARRGGYGSLAWRLQEDSISAAGTVPYIMKPEYRPLIPDFLDFIGRDAVKNMKHHLVRQLVLQQNYNSYNAVIILHGLAAKGDKAAAALFTQEEYAALLAVPADYERGRRILVAYGLLPKNSGARQFKPISEISALVLLVLNKCKDESETDHRLNGLDDGQKTALLLAVNFLRIQLAVANLNQIYGDEAAAAVTEIFREAVQHELARFNEIGQILAAMPAGTPMDLMLLDSVMKLGGIEAKSEQEWQEAQNFLQMGSEWLNQERVAFQCYLRFTLRAMAEPLPAVSSAADATTIEFLREIYFRNGGQAQIAERQLYFEDWIGTDEVQAG
jgi:hypothetical protein